MITIAVLNEPADTKIYVSAGRDFHLVSKCSRGSTAKIISVMGTLVGAYQAANIDYKIVNCSMNTQSKEDLKQAKIKLINGEILATDFTTFYKNIVDRTLREGKPNDKIN